MFVLFEVIRLTRNFKLFGKDDIGIYEYINNNIQKKKMKKFYYFYFIIIFFFIIILYILIKLLINNKNKKINTVVLLLGQMYWSQKLFSPAVLTLLVHVNDYSAYIIVDTRPSFDY